MAATSAGHGTWQFEPGGERYQHILDARNPGNGLVAVHRAPDAAHDLEVAVGPVEPADPAALWRIDDGCAADARSIHLRYPAGPDVAMFYNEIYPQEVPPGTYFCTAGFGTDSRGPGPCGYAGVQQLLDGSQIAIFSVWHRMADKETARGDALATTVAINSAATGTAFSGEGSGSSIRFPLAWMIRSDDPIRFVVTAEALGRDTVLSAYMARGEEPWISIGAMLRAETGGRLMKGLYGFIEDFARTGDTDGVSAAERSPYRLRSAVFANPWAYSAQPVGSLEPIPQVQVSVYSPHPLENVLAEPAPDETPFGVRLATGTAQLAQPSPVGRTIADPAPQRRIVPDLGGVPYL
jgi:hypothetical protein